MSPVRTHALLLILPLALAGCGSMPPHCVSSSAGEVCAESAAQAEAMAAHLVAARAALARWLPDYKDVELEVWVQDELDMGPFVELGAASLGVTRRKRDWARVHVRSSDPELVLVHELAHACMGASWDALSDALEEGLCDVANVTLGEAEEMRALRLRCAARTGPELRKLSWRVPGPNGGQRGLSVWGALGGSDASASTLGVEEILNAPRILRFEGPEADHAYGVSYFCVDRIVRRRGLSGLRALCARAETEGLERVPSAWALEAAGFADGAACEAAARVALFEARVHAVLGEPALWSVLAGIAVTLDPLPGTIEELVLRCEPALAFGAGPEVALVDLPGFLAAARKIQLIERAGASLGSLAPLSSAPGEPRPW